MSEQASLTSRLIRRAAILDFDRGGWRLEGKVPKDKKFVIIGAPHTSNWDFVIFLSATYKMGVVPSFIGKHTLFRGPFKRLMYDMGGIPINRGASANFVEQVVKVFSQRETLHLVIAPEGTRSSDGRWKSGFYHIALGAAVRIVPVWLDLKQRLIKVGAALKPTGDYAADVEKLGDFYRACDPGNPRFHRINSSPAGEAARGALGTGA